MPTSFTVDVTGGSAENGTDYNLVVPVTFPFEMSEMDETLDFCIPLTDDMIAEGDETIELTISSVTDDIEIMFGTYTITILDDDTPLPIYPIGEVNTVNENGVADSLNVECEIQGTVYGVNLRPDGLQFTVIDTTGGLGLFNFEGNFGYTVQEGDNVGIRGSISQFNGLTQMNPDTVFFISANNPLIDATVVTELNEFSESNLVSLECVSLVDPSQWSGAGSGFNVDVTDGTNTYTLRIDNDVDLYSEPAPMGSFTVVGLGGQFDSSEPFDSGYQLFPRYMADISESFIAPSAAFNEGESTDIEFIDGCAVIAETAGGTLVFTPSETGFATTVWTLLDLASPLENGTFDLSQATGLEFGLNNVDVTLTVTDENGCSATSTTQICIEVISSVNEYSATSFTAFPNPAQDQLTIKSDLTIEQVSIYNLAGQLISSETVRTGKQAQVNVTQLAQGTYLVEVLTAEGAARNTIVKQ